MTFLRKLIAVAALAAPLSAFAFPIASTGAGLAVVAGSTETIVATYQGTSASYSDDLYLVTNDGIADNDIFLFNNQNSAIGSTVDLGTFAVGTELTFRLYVNDTNNDFFSGEASLNPDDHAHARVQQNWETNTTLLSFEDLFGGPYHYDDLSFSFTNTVAATPVATDTAVPEPASMLLFGLALVVLATGRRRNA